MPTPLRLPKGKILRTKHAQAAALIFAAMPEGCARRQGNEVIVMQPVVMRFEAAPEPVPGPPKVDPKQPFIFDQTKR